MILRVPKFAPSHFGPGQVRAGQRGDSKVGIREVLAGEVHAGKIVACQADSGQIVGLVAGRRVELGHGIRQCDPWLPREIRPAHFGAGQVRAGQRGVLVKVRIREVGLAEVSIGQRGVEQDSHS